MEESEESDDAPCCAWLGFGCFTLVVFGQGVDFFVPPPSFILSRVCGGGWQWGGLFILKPSLSLYISIFGKTHLYIIYPQLFQEIWIFGRGGDGGEVYMDADGFTCRTL